MQRKMSSGRMKEIEEGMKKIEEGMREEERENVILEIHKQSHGRLNKKEERVGRISAPAIARI